MTLTPAYRITTGGPVRVQLSRSRKLPDGVRSVARPTRWGNPFKVGETLAVVHPEPSRLRLPEPDMLMVMEPNQEMAVVLHRSWLRVILDLEPDYLDDLRGATGLACWCPLDQPCHADNLIDALRAMEP